MRPPPATAEALARGFTLASAGEACIDAPYPTDAALRERSRPTLRIDPEPWDFVALDRLASTHGLSAYDPADLELALRKPMTVVSLDGPLLAAARALGHPCLDA